MTGASARCFLTERPWRPAYAAADPEIRIPRLQLYEDEGQGFGGGGTVVFRQAPVHRPLPPAPAPSHAPGPASAPAPPPA